MHFGKGRRIDITEGFGRFSGLLVPDVADSFEEEQRQDVTLPVRAIDGGTSKRVRGIPQRGFEFFSGQRHSSIWFLTLVHAVRIMPLQPSCL